MQERDVQLTYTTIVVERVPGFGHPQSHGELVEGKSNKPFLHLFFAKYLPYLMTFSNSSMLESGGPAKL